jgi:hypothetical protein
MKENDNIEKLFKQLSNGQENPPAELKAIIRGKLEERGLLKNNRGFKFIAWSLSVIAILMIGSVLFLYTHENNTAKSRVMNEATNEKNSDFNNSSQNNFNNVANSESADAPKDFSSTSSATNTNNKNSEANSHAINSSTTEKNSTHNSIKNAKKENSVSENQVLPNQTNTGTKTSLQTYTSDEETTTSINRKSSKQLNTRRSKNTNSNFNSSVHSTIPGVNKINSTASDSSLANSTPHSEHRIQQTLDSENARLSFTKTEDTRGSTTTSAEINDEPVNSTSANNSPASSGDRNQGNDNHNPAGTEGQIDQTSRSETAPLNDSTNINSLSATSDTTGNTNNSIAVQDTVMNNIGSKFSVEIFAGPQWTIPHTEGSLMIQGSDAAYSEFIVGMGINYFIIPQLSIGTGFSRSSHHSEFGSSTTLIIDSHLVTIPVLIENKFSVYDIPLKLSYTIGQNNLRFAFEAGAVFSILSDPTISMKLAATNQVIAVLDKSIIRSTLSGYYFAVSPHYYISDRFSVFIRPVYKIGVCDVFQNSGYIQKINSFSIQSGLNLKF